MKILRLSAYCEPEQISSSHLTNDLNEAFCNAGFEIENYVPMPTRGVGDDVRKEYKKKKCEIKYEGKMTIHRFSMFRERKNALLRAIRYILVNIVQYFKGCRAKNVSLIYSASTPPTQGVLCGMVKKRLKVPFVYNLQDIFPDSLVNSGLTKKGSLIWKIGRRIEDYTYRSADKIIVISEGLKKNIIEKGVPEDKISVVSNWIDLDNIVPVPRSKNTLIEELGIPSNKFIVVYAGNLGETQGADVILKAAADLQSIEDIVFVIIGGGSEYDSICKSAKALPNVIVHPLFPASRISEVYSLGDVAIITCKKGTGNAGFPSKTWSIMACNTPIIASFDEDSDLAGVLNRIKSCVCVQPENRTDLGNAIIEAYNKCSRNEETLELRKYAVENASKDRCVNRYISVIQEALS